tara:strand:- start:66 stop:434 length:369 start_codon:yes stop_codon:yes gene_type:complete
MITLTILINLVIALILINVWTIRFNKATIYRGGNAISMKEEFTVYGLPDWFMYTVGALKIMLSILLIMGIWIPELNVYSYVSLSALMIGAIAMHIKVKDPIIKSVPAFFVLILLLTLISNNL